MIRQNPPDIRQVLTGKWKLVTPAENFHEHDQGHTEWFMRLIGASEYEYIDFNSLDLELIAEEVHNFPGTVALLGAGTDPIWDAFIEKLVRDHGQSIWVIPTSASTRLRQILVPIDFSPASLEALRHALELNEMLASPAHMHAIHVYSPENFSAGKILRRPGDFHQVLQASKQEALQNVVSSVSEGYHTKVACGVVQRDMPGIAQYIAEEARKLDADLVVMGAKGYSKIERLMLGSTTEKWLQMKEKWTSWIVKT